MCIDIYIAIPLSRHPLSANKSLEFLAAKKFRAARRGCSEQKIFFYYLFRKESVYSCRIFFLLLLQPVQDVIVAGTAIEADTGLPIAGSGCLGQVLTAVTEGACR